MELRAHARPLQPNAAKLQMDALWLLAHLELARAPRAFSSLPFSVLSGLLDLVRLAKS